MRKLDLKTGMKLVLRNGNEYIYFDNFKHEFSESSKIGLGKLSSWSDIGKSYHDNLKSNYSTSFDIIEVYSPDHAYAIGDFFGAKNKINNEFTLIWKENLQSQKEFEMYSLD